MKQADAETGLHAPVLRDAASWEARLRCAVCEAEETVVGWIPAQDMPAVLPAMPEIAKNAANAGALGGMFLEEISWTHQNTGDGCCLTVRLFYDGTQDDILAKRAELLLTAEQWRMQYAMLPEAVRVLLLHDALIRNCTYDSSGEAAHTAYGAWICGRAVCDGYAAAFQLFASASDIPCMTVTGTALTDAGLWEPHAWNLVQLCGEWFHIDCTWDDSDGGPPLHTWFLRADAEMTQTHIWDAEQYPRAEGKTVSYAALIQEMQQ